MLTSWVHFKCGKRHIQKTSPCFVFWQKRNVLFNICMIWPSLPERFDVLLSSMENKGISLVIGASENPQRYSNMAIRMLRSYGHPVLAVGLKEGWVEDVKIEKAGPNLPKAETVTLYVGPQNQPVFQSMIEEMKPKRVIFNPGTENPEWEKKLNKLGIQTEEACTLVMLKSGQYEIQKPD